MTLVMWKTILRGFLVIFTHLRAIEAHLGMNNAIEVMDTEIATFREKLHE